MEITSGQSPEFKRNADCDLSPAREAVPPPLPVPVVGLDYFPPPLSGPMRWTLLARYKTPAEWHSARAPLSNANIVSRMNILPDGEAQGRDYELLVSEGDLPLAVKILEARRAGVDACPKCGAGTVRKTSPGWYWYLLAALFVGLPPIWPKSKQCEACGHAWG